MSSYMYTIYEPRSSYVLFRPVFEQYTRTKSHFSKLLAKAYRSNQSGAISDAGGKKIIKAIELLAITTPITTVYNPVRKKKHKFHLSFCTLTLPASQQHSDNEIKDKCLYKFLDLLSKKREGLKYVWKQEKQENGNVHFHIVLNEFFPYFYIRHIWNRRLNELGYIDRFAAKHGHRNPPTEQIISVRNVKDIGSYCAKYMAKKKRKDPVTGEMTEIPDISQGKKYGMSQSLRKFNYAQILQDEDVYDQI